MPGPKRRRSAARWIAAVLIAAGLVGGAVALADPDESEHAHSALAQVGATGACGPATAATIGAVDAAVARKIYLGELTGREVDQDVAHVAASAELASAVASGSPAAAFAVVHQIVYTPHWHIVRLRVVRGGKVLADVGGPYIIAPISGALRQNGVKVGSFVMSVQDDVGYLKLVTRFVGVPIDLYGGPPPRPARKFLMGTLQPAPPLPSDGAVINAHRSSYFVRVAQVNAMPNGKLHVALLVPTPAKGVAARSCATVRSQAWGGIVKHVAARFHPLASQYQDFVGTLEGSTGGLAYVREGSLQIAGLNAGPRHLPTHGRVMYHGRPWQVFSWEPHPPARVYFLAPS